MKVCPHCARENQPRAKFCDRCSSPLQEDADVRSRAQRGASLPPVDPLPPGDTAKGIPPSQAGMPLSQAGIPHEVVNGKGVHRKTQKLTTPMMAAGTPTARPPKTSQETIKVARVPAPAKANSAPTPSGGPDPEPDATIQGAVYLRQQEATRTTSTAEPVAWLVELVGNSTTSNTAWPVSAGVTFLGSSQTEVGTGVVANRPGLSPLHALIFHRHEQTWLVDLSSGAPTLCNGISLSPLQGHPLSEGDELRLGELSLAFHRAEPHKAPGSET